MMNNCLERINRLGPLSGGIFSYADLFSLIGASSPLQNKRVIKRLIKEKIIFKIKRGFYTTKNPDLWILACRMKKEAVISMDSVLAKNGLIGTIPEQSVSAVIPGGRREIIETPFGSIRYFSIKKELLFGFLPFPQGIRAADNEKAYLDLLYFYTKGARFVIDPLQEVNLRKLDRQKIKLYLKRYKNPKFVRFVKGGLDAIV